MIYAAYQAVANQSQLAAPASSMAHRAQEAARRQLEQQDLLDRVRSQARHKLLDAFRARACSRCAYNRAGECWPFSGTVDGQSNTHQCSMARLPPCKARRSLSLPLGAQPAMQNDSLACAGTQGAVTGSMALTVRLLEQAESIARLRRPGA